MLKKARISPVTRKRTPVFFVSRTKFCTPVVVGGDGRKR
ncbi:hypothetical protein CHK_0881 [Christensenella hongkongensis]|uniref:Uncharacterized protein n=1 Tax=Christensenella hongkongensis TaxID=270498 RepID=A0A0M2NGP7_9FIRM|nr:hypothetical protein CHK_0881 [Christensenella hongkongensis]